MVLIEGDLHCGWSGCGTSNIESTMHCYIIFFLVSTQMVEYLHFAFMLTWCFSWRRKKDLQLICEL